MTIRELCQGIQLPQEAAEKVLAFADGFDFTRVEGLLAQFESRQDMKNACEELRAILGEDEDGMKILACQLKASADLHECFQATGIGDEVYFATMACYTRFMNETLQSTGRLIYDRWWWTVRQAGFQLFRVGELEYEIIRGGEETYIDMHIPSDADFSPAAVTESLAMADAFLRRYFPDVADCSYGCHSWLLARELRDMLPATSNIVQFQNRFDILSEDEGQKSCHWVFKTDSEDVASLPEETSLQRRMKAHFLAGGLLHGAKGRLKKAAD